MKIGCKLGKTGLQPFFVVDVALAICVLEASILIGDCKGTAF